MQREILTALITLFASAAAEAGELLSGSEVDIVTPLSVSAANALDFGTVMLGPGNAGGTVTIGADTGEQSVGGGIAAAGGTPQRGTFLAYGPGNFLMYMRIPQSITLSRAGGTETLTVAPAADSAWANSFFFPGWRFQLVPADGVVTLGVGGTLTIPNDAPPGAYQGTYEVTVEFF